MFIIPKGKAKRTCLKLFLPLVQNMKNQISKVVRIPNVCYITFTYKEGGPRTKFVFH